jgi:hypothetical protein
MRIGAPVFGLGFCSLIERYLDLGCGVGVGAVRLGFGAERGIGRPLLGLRVWCLLISYLRCCRRCSRPEKGEGQARGSERFLYRPALLP